MLNNTKYANQDLISYLNTDASDFSSLCHSIYCNKNEVLITLVILNKVFICTLNNTKVN